MKSIIFSLFITLLTFSSSINAQSCTLINDGIVVIENCCVENEKCDKESDSSVATASYSCPECDCSMYFTGKAKYCQVLKSRTMHEYHCGCCSTNWWIYVD